ncbi:hypothetical protein [Embleya sp. NBC_00896]|uniref:hypothetical protein n=1 Tax=Embleya sp. NBC_00896 TaxID=2975961 RepID=UPI0038645AC4|nr:hypothetical protein OG928_32570 [Embleya sp. NBC_00896]
MSNAGWLLVVAVLVAGHVGWLAGVLACRNGKSKTEALAYGAGAASSAFLLYCSARGTI